MAEYIERNKVLGMSYCPTPLTQDNPLADIKAVVDVEDIESIPSADVEEVKHGEWIPERCNHVPYRLKKPEKWVIYKCSVCGYSNGRKKSNGCPQCRAKMDGKDINVPTTDGGKGE